MLFGTDWGNPMSDSSAQYALYADYHDANERHLKIMMTSPKKGA